MVRLRAIFRVLTLGLVAWLPGSASAQSPGADQRDWMYRQYRQLRHYVRGGQVEPHWLSDGQRFWFVEHGADEAPVYLVDPAKGIRRHLFDLSSLQQGLQRILEEGTPAEGLPVGHPVAVGQRVPVQLPGLDPLQHLVLAQRPFRPSVLLAEDVPEIVAHGMPSSVDDGDSVQYSAFDASRPGLLARLPVQLPFFRGATFFRHAE